MVPAGTLYLVATPIGNLDDITLRAVKTLQEANLIACEDTRHSRVLLDHFQIRKPLISYHNFNERQASDRIISRIMEGMDIALISDAGTPAISDPGYIVVREAIKASIPVVAIPGPSAMVAALAASGLPTDAFIFYGFLPQSSGKRKAVLQSLVDRRETLVFYESPFRIQKLLGEILEVVGNRQAALCRELTKKFEEIVRADVIGLYERLSQSESAKGQTKKVIKGEITLVVQGKVRGSTESK